MNQAQQMNESLGRTDELVIKDLRRIVNEFMSGLKNRMIKTLPSFDSEYTGMHVRALAQLLVEDDNAGVKQAKKELVSNPSIRL